LARKPSRRPGPVLHPPEPGLQDYRDPRRIHRRWSCRAHDGSLDLVCTQPRILKIFRITGLTEVFGIYETMDQAIAATKGRR
jgi:hypothetical protein